MKNTKLDAILDKLIKDFNEYSALVALSREQLKAGELSQGTFYGCLGRLGMIEDYLKGLADALGVKLIFKSDVHDFGFGEDERVVEYTAVSRG